MLIIVLPLFFAWEMLQMRGFTGLPPGWLAAAPICLRATLGDAVIVVALYGLGWIATGRRTWFAPPSAGRYAAVTAAGVGIQLLMESISVYGLGRWGYTTAQPLVPGLGLGTLPVLQGLFLFPFTFWLLARWEGQRSASAR